MNRVDLDSADWFKASYSNGNGNCVEVADLGGAVGTRDSKDPGGPAFVVPVGSWASFVIAVKDGQLSA